MHSQMQLNSYGSKQQKRFTGNYSTTPMWLTDKDSSPFHQGLQPKSQTEIGFKIKYIIEKLLETA